MTNSTALPIREPCDVCLARPAQRYRVVDADFNTIWSGGCRECAYMVVRDHSEWSVQHAEQ